MDQARIHVRIVQIATEKKSGSVQNESVKERGRESVIEIVNERERESVRENEIEVVEVPRRVNATRKNLLILDHRPDHHYLSDLLVRRV